MSPTSYRTAPPRDEMIARPAPIEPGPFCQVKKQVIEKELNPHITVYIVVSPSIQGERGICLETESMKKLVSLALLGALAAPSFAVVIDFEDLTGSGAVPVNYHGFASWAGWNYYDAPQPPYNPHSGVERVYSGSGTIDIGTDVVFNGAWFNGYGSANGFPPLQMDMYDNNVIVATNSVNLDASGNAFFLASNYSGNVDKVQISGPMGFFVMDDFTYNVAPEPVSMIALGAGVVALVRKRRSR